MGDNGALLRRARGCMLGVFIGDALGAGVEGWPAEEIEKFAQERWQSPLVQNFFPAVHMATHVSAGQPGQYREAQWMEDVGFRAVPVGPPSTDAVAQQCAREGCYTDDTLASLALAASLVEHGGLDANAAARRYGDFFREATPFRGCPPTAAKVMQLVHEGVPIEKTGLPPHFPFAGGSFANGGAMRIAPLAIAYREADAAQLRIAVEAATISSHRHPEAVDFAVVQAACVQWMLTAPPTAPSGAAPQAADAPGALFEELSKRCTTEAMRSIITATAHALAEVKEADSDQDAVAALVAREKRPGSGMSFQIASVHMAPCVLWCAFRYAHDPRRAIQAAIAIGGDTDTTAALVGAIVGARHGEGDWCAAWAARLENGPRGRDYALGLAEALARLRPGPLADAQT
jgi:poly(ADP-ribose) glycohydrolase ARH3